MDTDTNTGVSDSNCETDTTKRLISEKISEEMESNEPKHVKENPITPEHDMREDATTHMTRGLELTGTKMDQHRKLCHMGGTGNMKKQCKPFIQGKMTRTYSKKYSDDHKFNAGEYLHTDHLWMTVHSIGGSKYVIGLVDDATDYKWSHAIEKKNENEAWLMQIITRIVDHSVIHIQR